MEERTGGPYRRQVGRIQTEEINPRLAAVNQVGAHVQFRKARDSGQRRQSATANPAHMKGYDSNPALAVENIKREFRGDERPYHGGGKRPVSKEQIVPGLLHDPATRS